MLPIVVDLIAGVNNRFYLLQQPEIHLHPSAQTELGTFLTRFAHDTDNKVIIETHSDHLIDRIRMEVRDRYIGISHDDISILYFERDNLEVVIHELRLDDNGNITNAPRSYRTFFLSEEKNYLGYRVVCTIIIDANVAAALSANPLHSDAHPVKQSVEEKRLRIAIGGRLTTELISARLRHWLSELIRSGSVLQYRSKQINQEVRNVERMGVCVSNDTHIIALARVSGVRLLYSHDHKLHRDFACKRLVQKGKIYQSRKHSHLLRQCPAA